MRFLRLSPLRGAKGREDKERAEVFSEELRQDAVAAHCNSLLPASFGRRVAVTLAQLLGFVKTAPMIPEGMSRAP